MSIALLAAGALALAALAEAAPIGLAIAAAAWALALVLSGLPRVVALLVAPIALAASVRLDGFDLGSLVGGAAVLLSVTPLLRGLGAVRVSPRAALVFVLTWVGAVAFLVTPPGRILGASDLALGTAVVAAAAVLLALTPLVRLQRG